MPYYYPGARCITRHDHPLPGLGTVPAGALVEVKGYALDLLIVESIATGAVFSAAPSALEPEPLPVRPESRRVALPRFERLLLSVLAARRAGNLEPVPQDAARAPGA